MTNDARRSRAVSSIKKKMQRDLMSERIGERLGDIRLRVRIE